MVQFSSGFEEAETIEKRVEEQDVAEQALRVVAQKHEEQHMDGKHHVNVRELKDDKPFSEKEEAIIDKLKQKEESAYKRASVEQVTGVGAYASGNASGGSGEKYGHAGSHQSEASCTCGWRATPQDAMKEMFENQKIGTGVKYESSAGNASYNSHGAGLEGIAGAYQSPLSGQGMGGNYH